MPAFDALMQRRVAVGPRGITVSQIIAAAVIVFAIVFPLFFDPLSGFLGTTIQALAFVVMALGLNVVVGFAGLLDLGYVAFFAIGAYTTGWVMSGFYGEVNLHVFVTSTVEALPGIHLNFVLVLIVAAILCAIAGVIIGLPTLRLRGDYIAIVTLAFGEIIRVFAINGPSVRPFGDDFPLTAGKQSITPIDQIDLPILNPLNSFISLRGYYWVILGIVLLCLFVVLRLRDSRIGRAWIALREDEVAAASMGIPLVRTKLLAYLVGGAMGGLSGAFLGPYLQVVNADQFAFSFSIFILAMIILGGLGSVWGAVLGALLLTYINNYLIPDVLDGVPGALGLEFQFSDLGFGVFGFLLVVVMILRPQGLLPERRRAIELTEGLDGPTAGPPMGTGPASTTTRGEA
jgi:branched-chain amino acid transport system permease protein